MDRRLVLLTAGFLFWSTEAAVYYGANEGASEEKTEASGPRAIATNGNYTVSFVPLISLLAGVVPRLLSRIRGTPTTTARKLDSLPQELSDINPCLDSILDRKPYPGSPCVFYECELDDSTNALCAIQAINPSEPLPTLTTDTVSQTGHVRINKCLAIRIYKCAPSFVYDDSLKACVKEYSNFYNLSCPN